MGFEVYFGMESNNNSTFFIRYFILCDKLLLKINLCFTYDATSVKEADVDCNHFGLCQNIEMVNEMLQKKKVSIAYIINLPQSTRW